MDNEEKTSGWRDWAAQIISILMFGAIAFIGCLKLEKPDRLASILVGATTGFLVWTFTTTIAKLIDKSFARHDEKTTKILNVITEKHLNLVNEERGDLEVRLGPWLKDAAEVKISGRALLPILRWFEGKGKTRHPLAVRMMDEKDKRLKVQLLLPDPESEGAKLLDEREPGAIEAMRTSIRLILETLSSGAWRGTKELVERNPKGGSLAEDYSLELRVTKEPLNLTTTYVLKEKATSRDSAEKLLFLGMLFNGVKGNESPLYRVPPSTGTQDQRDEGKHLFARCLQNFDNSFNKSELVLLWTREKILVSKYWESYAAARGAGASTPKQV